MSERMTRVESWEYMSHIKVKTSSVCEKGNIACVELSSGLIVPAAGSTTGLWAIGTFDETVTGDGTKTVRIHLFREVRLHRVDNAVSGAVAITDFGNVVYWSDAHTVTKTSTGASLAGRVFNVTTQGVLILPTTVPG